MKRVALFLVTVSVAAIATTVVRRTRKSRPYRIPADAQTTTIATTFGDVILTPSTGYYNGTGIWATFPEEVQKHLDEIREIFNASEWSHGKFRLDCDYNGKTVYIVTAGLNPNVRPNFKKDDAPKMNQVGVAIGSTFKRLNERLEQRARANR